MTLIRGSHTLANPAAIASPIPPSPPFDMYVYCQSCRAKNSDDAETCWRCGNKLLVLSGVLSEEDYDAFDAGPGDDQISLDEHLLERISILEEAVKRTAGTVHQVLGALYKLEQKILVNQTGITTLRDLLEAKRLLGREEWSELWESRMDHQLLALEKRERFAAVREHIAGLYSGPHRDDFRGLLDEAEDALLRLDIDSAVEVLEEAHRLDPDNYELSFFLGETFFNESSADKALFYFVRVLAVKPLHFESLVYSGVLYHEQAQDERATRLLERAVSRYPEAFLPAFSLGAVHASWGRLPQAVVFLERAVETPDAIPQASFLLGSCYFEMGRTTLAIRNLETAVRQDPAYAEAHHVLGLAYLDRRWHRKALASFRMAQQLEPNRLEYDELLLLIGGHDGALAEVSAAARPWLRQAEASLDAGQGRLALSAFRRALAEEPESPALLLAYAMACLQLQHSYEIESVVERVLGFGPSEPLQSSAYATLIEALRVQGKFREGNRVGRAMLDEVGSPLAHTVAYWEMAFNLAEMEEDLDLALDYARKSVESSPAELERFPLAALGWVHYKRRELAEAVDCLTRSNELGTSARTLTHLGIALLAVGDMERARTTMIGARDARSAGSGLQGKVLEALKDGARLLQETS